MTDYAGIDYGLGQSNIDKTTGIRYGVISSHTIGEAWYDSAEADYGDATCPDCGNPASDSTDVDSELAEAEWFTGKDYYCTSCKQCFWSDSAFSEEPLGHSFEDKDYTLVDCLDNDVMVIKSPYYTFAQFCSPCVPGAGNLDHPCQDGPKTYCLGPEWFDNEIAPYDCYSVATDEKVSTGNWHATL